MNLVKQIFASKTIWFAILLAVGGVLEQSESLIMSFVGERNIGWAMLVISLLVALLRVVTVQPLVANEGK